MNVSRRKQNHPSRSASSPSALEEECAVSSTSPNPSFLPAGTSLGPFPVRPATEGDSPRDTITIRDVAGRSFGFALLGTESRALKALGEAHSASEANATVSPISGK
uniref:PDZ domain-containing protein n=1 Tax=Steinernema glaseri TaxID=37863 RepID=A0A1I7ZKB4_9BILA